MLYMLSVDNLRELDVISSTVHEAKEQVDKLFPASPPASDCVSPTEEPSSTHED